jgi:hypothetical protein
MANHILHLAKHVDTEKAKKTAAPEGHWFHLKNPNGPVSVRRVIEWMTEYGYKLEMLEFEKWRYDKREEEEMRREERAIEEEKR